MALLKPAQPHKDNTSAKLTGSSMVKKEAKIKSTGKLGMDKNRFVMTLITLSVMPPARPDTIPSTVPRMIVITEVKSAMVNTSLEP